MVNLNAMLPPPPLAERETIKLRSFLEALLADFESSARSRHLKLDALVFMEEVDGDPVFLRRLLSCLVHEALQHAPAGTNVSVVVTPRGDHAEFRIADEGAGGPADVRTAAVAPDLAYGVELSVRETEDGTIVCFAFPGDAADPAHRFTVDGGAAAGVAHSGRPLSRHESGIYARGGEAASTSPKAEASRPPRASGRNT